MPARLSLTLALLTGFGALGCAPRAQAPLRAIWVTRFDYRVADDVKRIVERCADAGFNAILFQVRGNATAYYESNVEPWSEEFDFKHPGYDPLRLAIDEAHARGVELHAWVNVMPAWRGEAPPANPEQVYNKRPEWFWHDQDGVRQPLVHQVGERRRAWYCSLNACLPEVREYLVEVFRDLAARYDVDGLHMDYIRFPNEAVVPGEKISDYPRDARTLALYEADTGLAPDDNEDVWNQWRARQVTRLVGDIHAMLREARPGAALTAAVTSVPDRAAQRYFQDARVWMTAGYLDAAILMNYTADTRVFEQRIQPWLSVRSDARLVPGLSFGRMRGMTDAEAAGEGRKQIEIARDLTANFCLFSYAALFDSRAEEEQAAQDGGRSSARHALREVLIPFLKELAARDAK